MKNIVLIGMRGSGKTTVGRALASRLGWELVELDTEVEKKAGMTIKKMVEAHGWNYFRDRESEAVKEAARLKNVVISTGGGVILRPENTAALKQNGICAYLNAPVDTLLQRIGGEASQLPRLTSAASMRDEMKKLLKERAPLYEDAADEIIETAHLGVGPIADTIQKLCYGR